jgi:putative FmdB family regulatory protein
VPTYSYACTACEHRFDTVQAFSDPSLTECPECTGRLRKLYTSVGIVFKGSGFYRTDSRAGSGGSEERSGSSAESGSESGSKADSKPESGSKSESKAGSKSESGASGSTNGASSGSSSSSGNSTAA